MNAPRIQPGDLCCIVGNADADFAGIAGRFVTVKKLVRNARLEVSWNYEGPAIVSRIGIEVQCLPASWLRPIGNPGADEVDEMVLLKPVPVADEVPA